MAHRPIPIIAFPYIYSCVAYVKEVVTFRGLCQLMGMVRKRTRARAIDCFSMTIATTFSYSMPGFSNF